MRVNPNVSMLPFKTVACERQIFNRRFTKLVKWADFRAPFYKKKQHFT